MTKNTISVKIIKDTRKQYNVVKNTLLYNLRYSTDSERKEIKEELDYIYTCISFLMKIQNRNVPSNTFWILDFINNKIQSNNNILQKQIAKDLYKSSLKFLPNWKTY